LLRWRAAARCPGPCCWRCCWRGSSGRALSGFALGGSLPPPALIPLVILWLGLDEGAKLFLVSLGLSWTSACRCRGRARAVTPATPPSKTVCCAACSTSPRRQNPSEHRSAHKEVRFHS
jgi:hypothetical protein